MILDINARSAFVDGEAAVGEALRREARAAIPVIVLGEFRCCEAWLSEHLAGFDVLNVTEESSTVYAELRIALRRAGRLIPANDAWIAVLALQHGLAVLSRDEHFDAVPSLRRQA